MNIGHRINEIMLGDVASEEQKQDVLTEMRQCVDHHKDYVEHELNVDLSDVEVKDDKELADDVASIFHQRATTSMYESAWRHGRLPNAYDKAKANAKSGVIELLKPVGRALRKFKRDPRQSFNANPLTKNIYVPFGINQQIGDQYGESRFDNLKQNVLHELSHIAWFEKSDIDYLEARQDHGAQAQTAWHEGFAEYCVNNVFDNIVSAKPTKAYDDHRRFIKQVVDREGQNIITDIPNNWPSLHRKHHDLYKETSSTKQ